MCLLKNKCANFEESTEGRACQWGEREGVKPAFHQSELVTGYCNEARTSQYGLLAMLKVAEEICGEGRALNFKPKSEIWMHVYVSTVSINSLYTVINTNNEIKESSLDVLKETCDQNYG